MFFSSCLNSVRKIVRRAFAQTCCSLMGGFRLAEAPTPRRGGRVLADGGTGGLRHGRSNAARYQLPPLAPVYPRQCMSPLWTIKTRRT